MSKIDDGGIVYPGKRSEKFQHPNGDGTFWEMNQTVTYHGMTLRDWFAGQALAGIMGNSMRAKQDTHTVVVASYLIADAMIAARKGNPND